MEEKYFTEFKRNGEIEIFEKDGAFYNHGSQDALIATVYDKDNAEKICKFLNEQSI